MLLEIKPLILKKKEKRELGNRKQAPVYQFADLVSVSYYVL